MRQARWPTVRLACDGGAVEGIGNHSNVRSHTDDITFTDVTWDAADLSVDHLLVQLFDVEGLHGEGQSPRQHGERAHAPGNRKHVY